MTESSGGQDNNTCETATVIPSLPYTDSGNTCGSGNECGNTSPDVFYKYTVQEPNEILTISLCNSSYDTYLWVWSDCCVSEITHDDDGCGYPYSEIVDCFYAGDIWIQVEGWSSECGDYVLEVSSAGNGAVDHPSVSCSCFGRVGGIG